MTFVGERVALNAPWVLRQASDPLDPHGDVNCVVIGES